jgi:hypothetical protein
MIISHPRRLEGYAFQAARMRLVGVLARRKGPAFPHNKRRSRRPSLTERCASWTSPNDRSPRRKPWEDRPRTIPSPDWGERNYDRRKQVGDGVGYDLSPLRGLADFICFRYP